MRRQSGQHGRNGQRQQVAPCAARRPHPPLLPALPALPGLPALSLLAACELTEVTIAPGRPVVVVQSIISRTEPEQFVVVEYSQAGDDRGTFGDVPIPPGNPKRPITGALVTITHGSGGACTGRVDTLPELPPRQPEFAPASGTYAGRICQPEPGEELTLRVETPAGEVVTGTTNVPGAATRNISPRVYAPDPTVTWLLNRVLDTLAIGVTPVSGKALQVEVRNSENLEDLSFLAFTDSMGLRIPGNLANPFEGDGESIFRAGRYYDLAVALTDSNYYDFLRSRSDPFTGRGFINHLIGGIGVFGSVETQVYRFAVVAPAADPREGVYRLTGRIDTLDADARLELYLDEINRNEFSAFVRCWPFEGGGSCRGPRSSDGSFSFDGSGEMGLFFRMTSPDTLGFDTYALHGVRREGGEPFPMIVTTFLAGNRGQRVDTLAAQQISGPGLATASPRR